jgi:hypothetical protein
VPEELELGPRQWKVIQHVGAYWFCKRNGGSSILFLASFHRFPEAHALPINFERRFGKPLSNRPWRRR